MKNLVTTLGILLALSCGQAHADSEPGSECVPALGKGCFYLPPGQSIGPTSGNFHLVVFIRGLYNGRSRVTQPSEILKASRDAFFRYGFAKKMTSLTNTAIFVTGSSHFALTTEDIAKLSGRVGAPFRDVAIASHSGGHIGLRTTLEASSLGVPLRRIVMLDNFYFGSHLTKLIQKRVQAGVECSGFLTDHNRARYESWFQPSVTAKKCPIEDLGRTSPNHERGVIDGFLRYLGY